MSAETEALRARRKVMVAQACVRLGSASKRYIEAAERRDVPAMLKEGLEVQTALELVAKLVTGTEVVS